MNETKENFISLINDIRVNLIIIEVNLKCLNNPLFDENSKELLLREATKQLNWLINELNTEKLK